LGKYKRSAAEKNIPFDLTFDHFLDLIFDDCHYCGLSPRHRVRLTGINLLCNGIDRIRSDKGYISDNVLTCCRDCNYSKNILSYNEFIEQTGKIIKFFIKGDIKPSSSIFVNPRYHRNIFFRCVNLARKKNLSFSLSLANVINLVTEPCFYCGGGFTTKTQIKKDEFIFTNGIDRLDSNRGYSKTNSVPCCKTCNLIKRDYEFMFFLQLVNSIHYNRSLYVKN
jgi:hypothetical protein